MRANEEVAGKRKREGGDEVEGRAEVDKGGEERRGEEGDSRSDLGY